MKLCWRMNGEINQSRPEQFNRVVFLLILVTGLVACSKSDRLDNILQQGELVVVTRNAPTTYYEGREGMEGFEYELVNAYAEHLGVRVRFETVDSISSMLTMLERGEVDLAAAGITHTQGRSSVFEFSVPYQQVTQQVVCRRGGKRPRGIEDLVDVTLAVPASSSYDERLGQLKTEYPQLVWHANHSVTTEDLLEQVWLKKLDCTVADSNIVDINRRYYPELTVRFDLSEPQELAWIIHPDADALADSVNSWLTGYIEGEAFAAIEDRYYGFIEVFDFVDIRAFKRRIKSRLPKYRPMFEVAAKKYGFDWTTLAALSYQESHWRTNARSPTGVRGIMMLTRTTAKEMGINNRLDAKKSIHAGARYLARLRKRIPDSVAEPDRDWMTLAAYNVGMGHLLDARILAEREGKNPDTWRDVAEVLPLLSKKKYYSTLRHGYARGREPVIYVQRIRDYQDILIRTLKDNNQL